MLTANEILKQIKLGNIGIDPFDINCLNPNSYNVHLADEIIQYDKHIVLDMKKNDNRYTKKIIPESGLTLYPNTLYIGSIKETVSSDKFISAIDGRSSIGRLGISIHSTAGFGDIGFSGTYTLEISVVQPVVIYPDMLIGQVYFTEPNGDIDFLYNGRYQNQSGAVESRINIDSKDISNYHYNKNI